MPENGPMTPILISLSLSPVVSPAGASAGRVSIASVNNARAGRFKITFIIVVSSISGDEYTDKKHTVRSVFLLALKSITEMQSR